MTPRPAAARPTPAADPPLDARVAELVVAFERVLVERMHDVPILHPGLRVEAVGFAPDPHDAGVAVGVLVTPWFMNVVRLPLHRPGGADAAAPGPEAPSPTRVGDSVVRAVGDNHRMAFIGSEDDSIGPFEACSLFSPMHAFVDHAAAVATAHEVLRLLRATPQAPPAAVVEAPSGTAPARRAFLFGRPATGARG